MHLLAGLGAALARIGGGSRIRTGDILLAKQTLYQLSYTPVSNEQATVNSEWFRGLSPFHLLTITYNLFTDFGGPDKNRTCDLVLIRDAL